MRLFLTVELAVHVILSEAKDLSRATLRTIIQLMTSSRLLTSSAIKENRFVCALQNDVPLERVRSCSASRN
jgi:hypothetical protein